MHACDGQTDRQKDGIAVSELQYHICAIAYMLSRVKIRIWFFKVGKHFKLDLSAAINLILAN